MNPETGELVDLVATQALDPLPPDLSPVMSREPGGKRSRREQRDNDVSARPRPPTLKRLEAKIDKCDDPKEIADILEAAVAAGADRRVIARMLARKARRALKARMVDGRLKVPSVFIGDRRF